MSDSRQVEGSGSPTGVNESPQFDRSRIVPRADWQSVPSEDELTDAAYERYRDDCSRALWAVCLIEGPFAAIFLMTAVSMGMRTVAIATLGIAAVFVMSAGATIRYSAKILMRSREFPGYGLQLILACWGAGALSLVWIPLVFPVQGAVVATLAFGLFVGAIIWHGVVPILLFNRLDSLRSRSLKQSERYVLHEYLLDAPSIGHGFERGFGELAKAAVTVAKDRPLTVLTLIFIMLETIHLAHGRPGINVFILPICWLFLTGRDLNARGRRPRPPFVIPQRT